MCRDRFTNNTVIETHKYTPRKPPEPRTPFALKPTLQSLIIHCAGQILWILAILDTVSSSIARFSSGNSGGVAFILGSLFLV